LIINTHPVSFESSQPPTDEPEWGNYSLCSLGTHRFPAACRNRRFSGTTLARVPEWCSVARTLPLCGSEFVRWHWRWHCPIARRW